MTTGHAETYSTGNQHRRAGACSRRRGRFRRARWSRPTGAADSSINIYLTVVPRAGCILPLRILTIVRQVSACPVVTPYGVDCKCGKQFGKFLFAFLCAGQPCANDHFSSSFVLNTRGLHNYIMINLQSNCRCIACRRCHGRLVIAPTISNDGTLAIARRETRPLLNARETFVTGE